MPTAFVTLKRLGSGSPAVIRYLGTGTTQVGPTLSAAFESASFNQSRHLYNCRVVQFKGADDLFVVCRDRIERYNGTTWTNVKTLVSPPGLGTGDEGQIYGFVNMLVNGVPTLVCTYREGNGGNIRATKSTDGTAWTDVVSGSLFAPGNGGHPWGIHQVGNTLYWFGTELTSTNNVIAFYTPSTDSFGAFALNGAITGNPAVWSGTAFKGRHYLLGLDDSNSDRPALMQVVGGSLSLVENLGAGMAPVVGNETKYVLWTDTVDLYGLYYHNQGSGAEWICRRWTDNGAGGLNASTDISATVLPTAFRSAGTPPATGRWGMILDPEDNPGGVPTQTLYYASTGTVGTSWSEFRWNGNASLIGVGGAANSTGGDTGHVLPFFNVPSGDRTYTSGGLHASIELLTPVLGAEQVSFRLFSSSGTPTVNFRLFYTKDGDTATTLATIQNASAGTIVSNQITGLTADTTGSTTYTVEWDTETDGLSPGQQVVLVGEISL